MSVLSFMFWLDLRLIADLWIRVTCGLVFVGSLLRQNWQRVGTMNLAALPASAPRSVAPFGGSARQGAGGDIAAQCPCQNQVPGDGKLKSGMGGRMGKFSLIVTYSRLCSLIFA